jgi:class 3 adenylate cyclase/tetratricopeptide (TPR) repeat protein
MAVPRAADDHVRIGSSPDIVPGEDSVICSNCGTENAIGAKFCTECATRLAVACPTCGTANGATAKFCAECATPLTVAGSAPSGVVVAIGSQPPTTSPVAERRLVSVLFADLVGFTPFAEERDAEDVRETLTRYFEIASDVIGRHGGTVEKFIGDAVMAVWGAPVAREDDVERAVRAGLELVDAVADLGPGIHARAGVLTGEAAVTLGATNQGMVAGDLVNTAARLQSVAAPGTVLVGEATYRAASRAIAFEAVGPQELKGKALPVAAWRAVRVVAEIGGRNRSETLEAPFVGRTEELRLLKELFHTTTRDRRPRLVSVIGPAGIGKTRLAWEFLKYVDGLVETVWWHEGRSPAYGDGITFWALGEMVRARCGLLETDDEATTRRKVAEALATHVPDAGDRAWIEPALLTLLGVETGVPSDQLFAAWRTFFERLATTAPVVMVFEDHHHADPGLLDFVDHLLEWSRNVPVYVLVLARPELLEHRPDWGAGARNFTSVHLEPLTAEQMIELLDGLVPGLPRPAVAAIVERADGIPLYAVEMVRVLVTDGRLAVLDGAYVPTGDLGSLAVPETLTALIASRLDGLSGGDRALVSDAAVLGQSFTLGGLAAVSGIAEVDLEPRLRALVRQELFTVETDPRSPERGQFVFVQALVREVAYNTLARVDRKTRHLAAARFFESLDSPELAGGLAAQYMAAFRNAAEGGEAEALRAQARFALKAAAGRAAALGSHDQAVRFLDQALSVTDDPADQAEILVRAGESASAAAHHEAAEAYLARGLALHRQTGDRVAMARTIAALAAALLSARQNERGFALLVPAAAEFADLSPDPGIVAIQAQLARAHMLREEHARSIEISEAVLEAAEHADLVPILADALVTKGSALDGLGRVREGLAVIQAGERLARANGLTGTALRGLNNRLATERWIDPQTVLDDAREGVAVARRVGDRSWALVLLEKVGQGCWLTGDWDGVLEAGTEGLEENPEAADRMSCLGQTIQVRAARGEPFGEELESLMTAGAEVTDPQILWLTVEVPAFAAIAAGRLAEAGASLRANVDRYDFTAPYWWYLAGWTALRLGDVTTAKADLAALDATGVHRPLDEARRTVIRAGLAGLAGDVPESIRLFQTALAELRSVGVPFDESLAGILMASVLDPRLPEVREATDRAREILVRLGARAFLEQLDAALERGSVGGGMVSPSVAPMTQTVSAEAEH